jgi:hypothetical protein
MTADPQPAQTLAQIQSDMLRPSRPGNIDGAFELGWGAALICFALSSYSFVLLPLSPATQALGWSLLVSAALAPTLVPKAIKTWITWPCTGYMAYRKDTKPFRLGMVVGLVVAIAASYLVTRLVMPEVLRSVGSGASPPGLVSRGFFGIQMRPVSVGSAKSLHLPQGSTRVQVQKVFPHTPAEAAGLHTGDVILEINGKVVNEIRTLSLEIAKVPPGGKVNVRILRPLPGQPAREQSLTATIGQWFPMPEPSVGPRPLSFGQKATVTVCLLFACAALGGYLGRRFISRRFRWPQPLRGTGFCSGSPLRTTAPAKSLPGVKALVFVAMIGGAILLFGTLFGLLYLAVRVASPEPVSGARTGLLALIVASNAVLYLMLSAGSIQRYPWKWVLLVLVVVCPLAVGVIVPGNYIEQSRPVMATLGLIWFLSGSATLWSYMRQTPKPTTNPA